MFQSYGISMVRKRFWYDISLLIKSPSYLYIENHTFTYSLIHLKIFVLPFSHFPSCVWDKINLSKMQKALIGTIL